ncbi:MAG TPA: HAD family hydrolase [Bacteroidales bacterium]|nr:HAD family hydrolase [Bacteroidales bacterium]
MKIDKSWTLFLDRDGVINKRIPGGYVRKWEEFEFIRHAPEAIKLLSQTFGRVLVVSNQQGIGKGIMTEADLEEVHRKMTEHITKAGGRIDRIYHSPFRAEENSHYRKPNTGMADHAGRDFPGIDFRRSVMAGDSESDMHFGRRMKMTTVLITGDPAGALNDPSLADYVFPDLITFARALPELSTE